MAGPYYYANIVCVTTKDSPYANATSPSPTSPAAAAPPSPARSGMTPACPRSTGANIIAPADSAPAMIMQLQTGTVDFVCTDMPTAKAAAARRRQPRHPRTSPARTATSSIASEEERAENVNIGISVQKGNTTLQGRHQQPSSPR